MSEYFADEEDNVETLDDAPKQIVISIGTLRNIYIYKIGELLKECTQVENCKYVIDEAKWEDELMPIVEPIIEHIKMKTGVDAVTEELLREYGLRAFSWEIGK